MIGFLGAVCVFWLRYVMKCLKSHACLSCGAGGVIECEFGVCLLWPAVLRPERAVVRMGHDEPESLILAQSERWRHA